MVASTASIKPKYRLLQCWVLKLAVIQFEKDLPREAIPVDMSSM